MSARSTVLITGVSGALGTRLLREVRDLQVIGVDIREPSPGHLFRFERIDLAEERSCNQLLELMRAYRPETVIHLAFHLDQPGETAARRAMWHTNVTGTSRVLEAIAEHNRTVGTVEKFIFSSGALVYGPEPQIPVKEDAPLQAHGMPLALQQQEADLTVQTRARALRKCRTYVLRAPAFAGADARNYYLSALRGTPAGAGRVAEHLRKSGARLPFWLPARGAYLEHSVQFMHTEDMARLLSNVVRRRQPDPPVVILNAAGRGDPLALRRCLEITGIEIKSVPSRSLCRQALRALNRLGVSDVPASALPYLLGSCTLDTSRLRVFLEENYRTVVRYTSEEALQESFAGHAEPELARAAELRA